MAERALMRNLEGFINTKYILLAFLVFLFLLVRVPILVTSIDKLHIEEELYRGNIAKELISGPILPLSDYQRSEYEGGSLVMGIMAVPFFFLFGESLLSLKLTALFFAAFTMIAWYLFLHDFFNRRIAVVASLLGIFPPPYFIQSSLCVIGAYAETGLFTILALFIFYHIVYIKKSKVLFALLGLLCGFALFFSYIFSITLAVILLFWLIFEKKHIFGMNFIMFFSFFLLGFSPWISHNLTHHFEGFIIADRPLGYWFSHNNLLYPLTRLHDLASSHIANSFGFEELGSLSGSFFSHIYYLIFAFSLCVLIVIHRRALLRAAGGLMPLTKLEVTSQDISRPVILIVFFLLYCLVLSLTKFEFKADFYAAHIHRYRYLIPTFPFMFAIIAVCYDTVAQRRKTVFFSSAIFCLILIAILFGLIHSLKLVSIDNIGMMDRAKIYRGYNYYDLGKIISWRYSDATGSIELVRRIKDDDDRRYCYEGMGWGLGKDRFGSDYSSYIRTVLPKIDKRYWPRACERVGRVTGYSDSIGKALEAHLESRYLPYFYRGCGAKEAHALAGDHEKYVRLLDSINPEYLPYLHEGIGLELFDMLINDTERFVRFVDSLDRQPQISVYRGIAEGKEYYRYSYDIFSRGIGRVGYDIQTWNELIDIVPDGFKPYCYQRLGIEVGWRFIHEITKYVGFLKQVNEQYRPYVYKGLGIGIGWRFGYAINRCTALLKQVDQRFLPFVDEGLRIGALKRVSTE